MSACSAVAANAKTQVSKAAWIVAANIQKERASQGVRAGQPDG